MYKKAILISAKGNLYYTTDFYHMGVKDKFRFDLYIFRQFATPGFSVGTPFLFNTDGTIPDRLASDHKREGDEIIYFNTKRDYKNFTSKNRLKPHAPFLDPNYPAKIDPYLA